MFQRITYSFSQAFIILFIGLSFKEARSGGAEIILPLKTESWVALPYSKIPENGVAFSENGISVKVRKSAGPIVHKLTQPAKVMGFSVKGKLTGVKRPETGDFDEDSILRFGLVATGSQTLSGPKKWFAADWVKKLFSLAPAGSGLDKIYFFNVTNRSELVGKSRAHPKSDLLQENIFAHLKEPSAFEFSKNLDASIETAAIWLSIDGDDSQSEFETVLNDLRLQLAP